MADSDARPIPLRNRAYRLTFGIYDADGDLVTGASGLDSEVSLDGGTFADCTNEAVEIATNSGVYYLDLTAAEMNSFTSVVITKTSTSGAKTTVTIITPAKAGDVVSNSLFSGVTAGSPSTTSVQLADGPSSADYFVGQLLVVRGVGSGRITAYDDATGTLTIDPPMVLAPGSGDECYILPVFASTAAIVDAMDADSVKLNNIHGDVADISSRIPAALDAGKIVATVGAYQTGNAPLQPETAGRTLSVDAAGAVALKAAAIGSGQFANASITAAAIASSAITSAKIASGALDSVWSTAERTLTSGANIALAKGTGVTGFNDPTAASVASAVRTELTTELGRIDVASSTLATASSLSSVATNVTTLLGRIGSFTGSGVNTVLGFFKALLSKAASTPSDVGGTFDAATDSTEAIRDNQGTTAPTAAQIADEVLNNTAITELVAGECPAEPTVAQALMLGYMKERNGATATKNARTVRNDDGDEILSATMTNSDGTFSAGKLS